MLVQEIDVPGGRVVLRDVAEVTYTQRRPYSVAVNAMLVAMQRAALDDDPALEIKASEVSLLAQEALVLALVESWSFPAPVTAAGLASLPSEVVDSIVRATVPLANDLQPDWSVKPGPEVPTPPSAD
jgi:hypothetical protein